MNQLIFIGLGNLSIKDKLTKRQQLRFKFNKKIIIPTCLIKLRIVVKD